MQKTGFSGWYFRVLEEGWVARGDTLMRIGEGSMTIEEANDLMHKNKKDVDKLRAILAEPALSASWRATFEQRLAQLSQAGAPSGGRP